MKYRDYKHHIVESLKPSIDDSDVLNIFQKYSIQNDRTKMNGGEYLYKFDNRYSIIYDGSTFVLYRHEDRIHMENARNMKEIDGAINKWLASYSLDSVEVNGDDNMDDKIDQLVNKMNKNADDHVETEDETKDSELENDDVDNKYDPESQDDVDDDNKDGKK